METFSFRPMLILLSPAKTLDFDTAPKHPQSTSPVFLDQAESLVKEARKLSVEQLEELMGVSTKIATLNRERFRDWSVPFSEDNAKVALLAFKGDVYTGLDAESLDQRALKRCQKHIRILSGLYGLLRPMDLMQPYRLEMGLPFKTPKFKNLYGFWGSQITEAIEAEEKKLVINLASNEYFKSVQPKDLSARVITPDFRDFKNRKYKVISFFAKKARGWMARYLIEKKITKPEGLHDFDVGGYAFNEELSSPDKPVFTRVEAPE